MFLYHHPEIFKKDYSAPIVVVETEAEFEYYTSPGIKYNGVFVKTPVIYVEDFNH